MFDRGRAVGGRLATRRRDGFQFDHGAQYFTVSDGRFARAVDAWLETGLIARWHGRVVTLRASGAVPEDSVTRYVAVPGMRALASHLAADLEVTTGCAVSGLRRDGDSWYADMADGASAGPFDAAVIAMPVQQSARLALPESLDAGSGAAAPVPCWCAMAAFDQPLGVTFDGAFVNSEVIDWVARDSSKPGRPTGERWVIHASAGWSASRLDTSADAVAHDLLATCFDTLGLDVCTPSYLGAHRWSLARPGSALDARPRQGDVDVGCVFDLENKLAYCGDWCGVGDIESAWLSGVAAAGRIAAGTGPR